MWQVYSLGFHNPINSKDELDAHEWVDKTLYPKNLIAKISWVAFIITYIYHSICFISLCCAHLEHLQSLEHIATHLAHSFVLPAPNHTSPNRDSKLQSIIRTLPLEPQPAYVQSAATCAPHSVRDCDLAFRAYCLGRHITFICRTGGPN